MPADIGSTFAGPGPYTAEQNSSDKSQDQKTMSDDQPVDVNFNASIGRVQAQTNATMAEEFKAASARRTILADWILGKQTSTP